MRGVVESTLGPDRKPRCIPNMGVNCTTFYEWFNHIPGVTILLQRELVLYHVRDAEHTFDVGSIKVSYSVRGRTRVGSVWIMRADDRMIAKAWLHTQRALIPIHDDCEADS